MKERERKLKHSILVKILDYDPKTGSFHWLVRKSSRASPGDKAGCTDRGHCQICINGTIYFAHRLAWFYVYKKWPENELDHINLDRLDNRIENLREATHAENMRNAKIRKHNSLGFKGVLKKYRGQRYIARITFNKKQIHLGTYDTPEQAHAAYVNASTAYHGEFGRTE